MSWLDRLHVAAGAGYLCRDMGNKKGCDYEGTDVAAEAGWTFEPFELAGTPVRLIPRLHLDWASLETSMGFGQTGEATRTAVTGGVGASWDIPGTGKWLQLLVGGDVGPVFYDIDGPVNGLAMPIDSEGTGVAWGICAGLGVYGILDAEACYGGDEGVDPKYSGEYDSPGREVALSPDGYRVVGLFQPLALWNLITK